MHLTSFDDPTGAAVGEGAHAVLAPSQKNLFLKNRHALEASHEAALAEYETAWIEGLLSPFHGGATSVMSFGAFQNQLDRNLAAAAAADSPGARFLAQEANHSQFKLLVEQFAVDGLTEAQSFLAIVPRLPLTVQMPIMRILIDEFGCGNIDFMHSRLYQNILLELGSSIELADFIADTAEEVYEFVNIFHWMTKRAAQVEYFLGALAWFEAVVPTFFNPYMDACMRLGIKQHAYYSEHIHIDFYHARSALVALRELEKHQSVDYRLAWLGVQAVEDVTNRAFDAAVARAHIHS